METSNQPFDRNHPLAKNVWIEKIRLGQQNIKYAKEGDIVVILEGSLEGSIGTFVRWKEEDWHAVLQLKNQFPDNVFVHVLPYEFVPLDQNYDVHPKCEDYLIYTQVRVVQDAQRSAGKPKARKRRVDSVDPKTGQTYYRCYYTDEEDCECVHGGNSVMGLFGDDFY